MNEEQYKDQINKFLIYLEFQTACSMEMQNLNFKAQDDLTYKNPIYLN